MLSSKEQTGFWLVLTTAFVSGFSIFINKIGLKGIDPFVFTGSKNFLVAIFLFLIILMTGKFKSFSKLSAKNWLTLAIIGLLGGSLPFLLFFKWLALTTAAQASFIHKNSFLLVIPLAWLVLKERLNKKFLTATLLLVLGNLFFFKLFNFKFGRGDLLIFSAAAFWAIENIIAKKVLKTLSASIVAFGRMFFGTIIIGLFLITTGRGALLLQSSPPQIAWVGLTSFFLLAYLLSWYQGLKTVRVSLASCVLVLGSPITAFLSAVFLNNGYPANQLVGSLLIISGLVFSIGFKKSPLLAKFKKLAHVRS